MYSIEKNSSLIMRVMKVFGKTKNITNMALSEGYIIMRQSYSSVEFSIKI